MTQKRNDSEFQLTVIGMRRDGRRRYDPQAKRALVEAVLQPGVSLAGLALKHGVNANLLRKWVVRHQCAGEAMPAPRAIVPAQAFVPVVEVACDTTPVDEPPPPTPPMASPAPLVRPTPAGLKAHLPNGIGLEFACSEQDAALVTAVIDSLGRCDVPPGR